MQTKLQSIVETLVQTAIGYTVAITSQLLIFPFFGIDISFSENLLIGVWFTIISIARGYVVRRVFNHLHRRR